MVIKFETKEFQAFVSLACQLPLNFLIVSERSLVHFLKGRDTA